MPKRSPTPAPALLAPPARSEALRLPAREAPLRVDDHLVQPEVTRDEILRGRRILALPGDPPHADRHCDLDYLIGAHLRPEYVGATGLLTRQTADSNFATDTSIRKRGIDPATGCRYLEEVTFEIVNEQSLKDITERAEDLSTRGVRRILAIFVKKNEVKEWSTTKRAWTLLPRDSELNDPCFIRPIAVRALLDADQVDNEVARALLIKRPPAIVEHEAAAKREGEGEAEGRREGKAEGLREGEAEGLREGECRGLRTALYQLLERRSLVPSEEDRARIEACDTPSTLQHWIDKALTATRADDIFT